MGEITKTKPKFITSDGCEFDTEDGAERHEELVAARDEYERARLAFGRALARTQTTADGHPFDLGIWAKYWRVRPGWAGVPDLERMNWMWGGKFDFCQRGDELVLIEKGAVPPREVPINEIYATRREADKALLIATEEWIAERQQDLALLREELTP